MSRKKLISIDVIQDDDKTNVSGLPENLTLRMSALELPIKIGTGVWAGLREDDPKEDSEKDQQDYMAKSIDAGNQIVEGISQVIRLYKERYN